MEMELSQLSLSQLQKLVQQQQQYPNPNSWAWNGRQPPADDHSWEVRAFADDTGSFMGSTWPPRSYTCTFCRREFRSAQALGGHMNVHRRDRARLRQSQSPPGTNPSPLIFQPPEFVAGGGFCLLYPLPTSPTVDSPPTVVSVKPYQGSELVSLCSPSIGFSTTAHVDASLRHPGKVESIGGNGENKNKNRNYDFGSDIGVVEDVDLELRLGW